MKTFLTILCILTVAFSATAQKSIFKDPGDTCIVDCHYDYLDTNGVTHRYTRGERISFYRIDEGGVQQSVTTLTAGDTSASYVLQYTSGFYATAMVTINGEIFESSESDTVWAFIRDPMPDLLDDGFADMNLWQGWGTRQLRTNDFALWGHINSKLAWIQKTFTVAEPGQYTLKVDGSKWQQGVFAIVVDGYPFTAGFAGGIAQGSLWLDAGQHTVRLEARDTAAMLQRIRVMPYVAPVEIYSPAGVSIR